MMASIVFMKPLCRQYQADFNSYPPSAAYMR